MSDTPCVKPSFDPLPDTPLFEDCTIAASPPPITDCPDLNVPVPVSQSIILTGGGAGAQGSMVLPIVVVGCADCVLTVRYALISGGSVTPIGSPFTAVAVNTGCMCQNIWPGMIGTAAQQNGGTWIADISGVSPQIAFRLTANMSGGSAAADIYVATGGSFSNSGRTTTVHDTLNTFPSAKSGASGYAFCRATSDGLSTQWEISYLQQKAPLIKFQLTAKLNLGDTTASGTVKETYGMGYYKPEVNDVETIKCTLKWTGAKNTQGLAFLDSDGKYVLLQLDCSPVTT